MKQLVFPVAVHQAVFESATVRDTTSEEPGDDIGCDKRASEIGLP